MKLTKSEKQELIKKQDNKCPVCNGLLLIHDELEVDHIEPISKGGKDENGNLQVTHKYCNRKKGVTVN